MYGLGLRSPASPPSPRSPLSPAAPQFFLSVCSGGRGASWGASRPRRWLWCGPLARWAGPVSSRFCLVGCPAGLVAPALLPPRLAPRLGVPPAARRRVPPGSSRVCKEVCAPPVVPPRFGAFPLAGRAASCRPRPCYAGRFSAPPVGGVRGHRAVFDKYRPPATRGGSCRRFGQTQARGAGLRAFGPLGPGAVRPRQRRKKMFVRS